jgi:hypothetical protein
MASTITPQNLTVNITTSITLNGQQINSENQLTIPSINEFDKRIMTIPTASEVTVVAFGSQVAAGTFVRGDMKYFQVTNLDTVNYARLRVKKDGSETFDVRVDAGRSFIMSNTKESVSATASAFAAFVEADSISMQAYDGNIDVEYIVASI